MRIPLTACRGGRTLLENLLENSLYEDSDEERELLREQNELEHMLEIQNYVR